MWNVFQLKQLFVCCLNNIKLCYGWTAETEQTVVIHLKLWLRKLLWDPEEKTWDMHLTQDLFLFWHYFFLCETQCTRFQEPEGHSQVLNCHWKRGGQNLLWEDVYTKSDLRALSGQHYLGEKICVLELQEVCWVPERTWALCQSEQSCPYRELNSVLSTNLLTEVSQLMVIINLWAYS